jgi:hypothetical protein
LVCIAGGMECLSHCMVHLYVVWVAVCAGRIVRYHDLRLNPADMADQRGDDLVNLSLFQRIRMLVFCGADHA